MKRVYPLFRAGRSRYLFECRACFSEVRNKGGTTEDNLSSFAIRAEGFFVFLSKQ
jgi:hypothetical protein